MIDRIRHDIQQRLDQLLAEADKLRRALAALDPRQRSAPEPKPTRSRPTTKPTAETPTAARETPARTPQRAVGAANGASGSPRTAPRPARRRSAPRGSSCGLVARSANAHVTSSWPSAPLPLDSVPVPLFVWDASLGLDDSVGWTSVTQRCVCCERARRCGVGRPVGAYRERHANRPGASPRTRSATRPAPPTPTRARSW